MLNRRNLITGLISFAAAPAIVRAESLMKVKVVEFDNISMRRIAEYVPFAVNINPKAFWLYYRENGTLIPFTKEQTEVYWKNFNARSE